MRRDPLPVTMSGVRMGERVLQVGVDDPGIVGAIAAKVGLSGHAAMVVADDAAAARAQRGIEDAGGLVELHVGALDHVPFPDATFDAVVLHNVGNMLAAIGDDRRGAVLAALRRVLRDGGRIVVIDAGQRTGLGAMLKPGPKPDAAYEERGGTVAALQAAGFRPVRTLGEREGFKFTEGLRT